MPSGPTKDFAYAVRLMKNNAGQYYVDTDPRDASVFVGTYTVYDSTYGDSVRDNQAILGDIVSDRFDIFERNQTVSAFYIGKQAGGDKSGFVDKTAPGRYDLYTNDSSYGPTSAGGHTSRKVGDIVDVALDDPNDPTTQQPLCYVAGTLLSTPRGRLAVERLSVGDVLIAVSGAHRPIRWLGHRVVDCRSHPRPHDVHPVRISAGAFGPGLPVRDLYLSPGHPVLVGADGHGKGGYLVPIMCLINGTTIARVPVDTVAYWHVELDAHDILLAEGLPAESYIDLGSRPWFAGADGALYDPDMTLPGLLGRCRPVAIDGPVVEAERRRLDMAFAVRLEAACEWPDEAAALAE